MISADLFPFFLTHLICFSLNLRFFNRGYSFYCNRINLLMRLPVPFVESRIVDSVLIAIIGLPLRSSKNSSIEIFFGRPSAWYKRSSSAGLLPTGRKNQRLSKSLLLYTICRILKISAARLCRLFRRSQERYHFPSSYTIRQN